jgi:uncharacterized membrane protein YraQ (UPF0718 family)
MPLFAGIYKKGTGPALAIPFLFVGPAINVLAITFAGVQIGVDIALVRIVLSIVFGITIGPLMAWFLRKDDETRAANGGSAFARDAKVPGRTWAFFALLLAGLVAGTLLVGLLL